jgi:hypothetical protein
MEAHRDRSAKCCAHQGNGLDPSAALTAAPFAVGGPSEFAPDAARCRSSVVEHSLGKGDAAKLSRFIKVRRMSRGGRPGSR